MARQGIHAHSVQAHSRCCSPRPPSRTIRAAPSNTGGAGPIFTISATTLEAGHGAVAFLYEYLKFGGLGDSDLIAAAGKHIHAHSIGTHPAARRCSAAYGVTDDLMVSVRMP